ncbi:MAG: hypothetical protein AAGG51_12525 [Cyanobacteria bacterium P01_G01_bin.54]
MLEITLNWKPNPNTLTQLMQIALQDQKNIETLLDEAITQYLENYPTQQTPLTQEPTPNRIDPRTLSGMLYDPNRQTVSLAEMDVGIAECAGESA